MKSINYININNIITYYHANVSLQNTFACEDLSFIFTNWFSLYCIQYVYYRLFLDLPGQVHFRPEKAAPLGFGRLGLTGCMAWMKLKPRTQDPTRHRKWKPLSLGKDGVPETVLFLIVKTQRNEKMN